MSDEKRSGVVGPCTSLILSRRKFLRGASGAAVTLAAAPLMSACEFVEVYGGNFPESVAFDLSDAQFAPLADPGGMACLIVEGEDDDGNPATLEALLVRDDDDTILAFDRYCPHANLDMSGCDSTPEMFVATWDADARTLTCRWHVSVFDAEGNFLEDESDTSGVLNLRRFDVEFDPATGQGTMFTA